MVVRIWQLLWGMLQIVMLIDSVHWQLAFLVEAKMTVAISLYNRYRQQSGDIDEMALYFS